MVFHVFGSFALRKGFTGFTRTARVAVVVAKLVAVAVAIVAAVVVLVEVADRPDVDPQKGFGRAWRTHSSQITQSSAQSRCFCRRVQRSNSAKDNKATVSAFLEWHTLQGIVWSRAQGRAGKRDKWVPNIAYFCGMVLGTHRTGHCAGRNGEFGIPVRGEGCELRERWFNSCCPRTGKFCHFLPTFSQ